MKTQWPREQRHWVAGSCRDRLTIAQARRLILDAIASVEAGELPPGSVRTSESVRLPHPFEGVLDAGVSWRDLDKAVR